MTKYSHIAIATLALILLATNPSMGQGFIKKLENKLEEGSESLFKKKEKGEVKDKVEKKAEEKAEEKKDDTKKGITKKGKMDFKASMATVKQKVEN